MQAPQHPLELFARTTKHTWRFSIRQRPSTGQHKKTHSRHVHSLDWGAQGKHRCHACWFRTGSNLKALEPRVLRVEQRGDALAHCAHQRRRGAEGAVGCPARADHAPAQHAALQPLLLAYRTFHVSSLSSPWRRWHCRGCCGHMISQLSMRCILPGHSCTSEAMGCQTITGCCA